MNPVELVIWDWNGTLLNDVDACIRSINTILKKRNLPVLEHERYRDIFTFPVKEYYDRLGFDYQADPFPVLADEYMALYHENVTTAALQPGAREALEYCRERKTGQVIVSAMQQQDLDRQVEHFGIRAFFDAVVGISDIYARSKADTAKAFFSDHPEINRESCTLIGDTCHDRDVARTLGCGCVLVGNGHQNPARFGSDGNIRVLADLSGLDSTLSGQ